MTAEPASTTKTQEADQMLHQAWALSDAVALRPEPFGALAYHFGNRKLTFLKRPQLVALVQELSRHPDVESALEAADIPDDQHSAYLVALHALAQTDMIRRRAPGQSTT